MTDRSNLAKLPLLSASQRAMLEFALNWLPFGGGGDEEILPKFGVRPDRFYCRVSAILDSSSCEQLDPVARDRLRQLCARKLLRTHPLADGKPTTA